MNPKIKLLMEEEMTETLTTPAKEVTTEFPGFSWDWFDPELLRGTGLSFPITINIKIGPKFGLMVMAAIKSFRKAYASAFEDPDMDLTSSIGDSVTMAEKNEIIMLGENDMALEITYIDGATRLIVLTLRESITPTSH